jgi:hypothetical protein
MTGSRLQMILDEKSIYDKELETTGGKFQEVKSEKTTISSHPNIEMVQNSGSKPVALTVRGLSLVKAERSAISVKEPTIPAEEPTIPAKEPTIPAQESTVPAEKPTIPAKEPTIPAQESTVPAEKPTIPTEEPTIPAKVTQTESAQQTTRSSGSSKTGGVMESGSHVSMSNLESESVTGTGTSLILPTTSGPVEIVPNKGGHDFKINTAAVYIIPLIVLIIVV